MDELTAPLALSDATLGALPDGVTGPLYDRAALRPGIVHIGVGNFHRAHMAWHLHRLMQQSEALDWAILGAGVRPADADMRARLLAQDGLTTLIELSPDRAAAEIIGPMVDFLPVQPDNAALIGAMADPAIRIVSLTVTEGGYYLDPLSGGLDLAHPDIRADAAAPQAPRTAFGALVAALARRRDAGLAPFAALSCDNLQGNGDILRAAVVSLARLSDPALADWIAARGAFPNSMVDCIVPATGPAERALARALGLADAAPVTHEPFRQWVIEDRFPAGRPAWEKVGAVFTDDVHAYETMKLRLLNAGHQLLANAGEILGVETIAECMAHPRIRAFFDRALRTEVAPFVPAVPGMTPQAYVDLISGRFANAAVRDTARRVAFDGSARHAGFLHPSLRDALAAGAPLDGLALAEALWARMCAGHRQDGSAIAPNDPAWPALTAAAQAARADPAAWLAQADLYGDLARARPFAQAFDRWLRLIWSDGAEAALAAYAD